MYPIIRALECGRLGHCIVLMRLGFDVDCRNKDGCTPLMLCCQLRTTPMTARVIRELIAKGANSEITDKFGRNALILAILCNRENHVRILLENNDFDLNYAMNDGNTALHVALQLSQYRIASSIISKMKLYKVNLEKRDSKGHTPAMIACARGQWGIVREIYGANSGLKSNDNIVAFIKKHFSKYLQKESEEHRMVDSFVINRSAMLQRPETAPAGTLSRRPMKKQTLDVTDFRPQSHLAPIRGLFQVWQHQLTPSYRQSVIPTEQDLDAGKDMSGDSLGETTSRTRFKKTNKVIMAVTRLQMGSRVEKHDSSSSE